LIPVWLPGKPEALIDSAIDGIGRVMTGEEGAGGGGGRSSVLHMSVVQHLEVQLTIVCPWFVKVVFFKLANMLGIRLVPDRIACPDTGFPRHCFS